jgi:MFS-type transporter involved in bile tolerance (Atg22 family)
MMTEIRIYHTRFLLFIFAYRFILVITQSLEGVTAVNTMTGVYARQAMNWSQNIYKNLFWHFSLNERWEMWERPVQ